jgi:hypothetical protein
MTSASYVAYGYPIVVAKPRAGVLSDDPDKRHGVPEEV